jgi:hypothetical protein
VSSDYAGLAREVFKRYDRVRRQRLGFHRDGDVLYTEAG